ncbi:hypothetical protein BOX15_Mlig016566g1, partial [Macrostomum lignano]
NLSNSRQQARDQLTGGAQQQQQQQLALARDQHGSRPRGSSPQRQLQQQQQQQQQSSSSLAEDANAFDFTTVVPHYTCYCRWEINNWTSLPFVTGHYLDSPSFYAEECPSIKWCLRFYPHGDCQQFRDWICVFVVLKEVDTETPFRPIISKAHFKMEGPVSGGGGGGGEGSASANPPQIQRLERRSESLSFAVHGTHGWSVVLRSEFHRVRHLTLQLTVHFSVPSQVTTYIRGGIGGSLIGIVDSVGDSASSDLLLQLQDAAVACHHRRAVGLADSAADASASTSAAGASSGSTAVVQRHGRLSADLRRLLDAGMAADVRLRLDCGAEFPAHKCLLAARSPVFLAMFTHDCLERSADAVTILDAEAASFKVFLDYLYTGEVPLSGLEANGRELLKLADKYSVSELRAVCAQALARGVTLANLHELAVLADTYQVDSLLHRCTQFMREHAQQVLASEDWRDLMQYRPALAQQLLVQMTKRHD